MFTGIVEEKGIITALNSNMISIAAEKVLVGTQIGDSLAVNGVCLSVISLSSGSFTAQLMPETIRRSNLIDLRVGQTVNLERAALLGSRVGGHYVQGHIDGVGTIKQITPDDQAVIIKIATSPAIMKYIVDKCFIAVDGVSLTEVDHTQDAFCVSLVDITRRQTRFGSLKVGDTVNIEVDIMAKYANRINSNESLSQITEQYLKENGF